MRRKIFSFVYFRKAAKSQTFKENQQISSLSIVKVLFCGALWFYSLCTTCKVHYLNKEVQSNSYQYYTFDVFQNYATCIHTCIVCHVFRHQHPFWSKHGKWTPCSCQFSIILLIFNHWYITVKRDVFHHANFLCFWKWTSLQKRSNFLIKYSCES